MQVNVVPKDFAAALKAGGLDEFFAGCTNSHRREYLKWIEEAKLAGDEKETNSPGGENDFVQVGRGSSAFKKQGARGLIRANHFISACRLRVVNAAIKLLLKAGRVRVGEDERRSVGQKRDPVNEIGGCLHGVIKSGHAGNRE